MTKTPEDVLYSALFRIVREDTELGMSQGMRTSMGRFATIADAALREYQHLKSAAAAGHCSMTMSDPTPPDPKTPAGEALSDARGLPFECYSNAGMFRAEQVGYDSWNIYSINFHGDRAFVDWTNGREDAVRLARMHADMELPS